MNPLKIFHRYRYPDSFKREVLRMTVTYDEHETEQFQFHVIPLVRVLQIGETIYHGYKGQDLKLSVKELMEISKELTKEKHEGIWWIYCYNEDRHKAKQMLERAVENDLKKSLMLGTENQKKSET